MGFDRLSLSGSVKRLVDAIYRDREFYLVVGAVTFLFVAVLGVDVFQSSRFWKDLQDVRVTFAPFITISAFALGASLTCLFTDHGGRNQKR